MKSHQIKYLFLGGLFIVAILIWSAVLAEWPNNKLKVYFFDVGQGSSVFIEAPDKKQILVDGGPDATVINRLGEAMPFYDKTIDLLVLTHPDADHLNGLIEVLRRYEVGRVVETGILDNSAAYAVWHNLIKEKNIPITFAEAGESIKISQNLKMDILAPLVNLEGKSATNTNNTSVVGRLIYGEKSFLFVGDAESAEEAQILGAGLNIDSDVLLVGHHGSKSSTSDLFLRAVSPEIAVIQAGALNKYGHPTAEILQKLKDILTLRTDVSGDIKIISDGIKIWKKL